jgi:HD-GYP domain-containing protein (c-di-GMP phosphodiesterase class II)
MSPSTIQREYATVARSLAQRCQSLDVTLLTVDMTGCVTEWHPANNRPLDRVLVSSPLFAASLKRFVPQWADQDKPAPVELWTGCWLVVVPQARRRRRVGYHVAVLLTADLVHAEQFRLICDQSRLDWAAATSQFLRQPTFHTDEVARWSALLSWMVDDLSNLDRQNSELSNLSDQLSETYEELSLVYKLSAHLTVTENPRSFLADACAELQQVIGFRWMALQLTDADARLEALRGDLVTAGDCEKDRFAVGSVGRQLLQRFGCSSPTIIDDTRTLAMPTLERLASKLLIVPIAREDKPLAILIGADKLDGSELSSIDSKLVTSTAQNMGIFIENMMLYEDMQGMFMGTLHSLISSIDAKDSYTCGHSERVAWLSRELAVAAGLDTQTVERVYLSGLVHDVGKIGVPESVLCKAGKLTDEEFAMVKAHPEIGVRILKDIRQMQDLLPGVLHHHERWDGKGYPYGLSGEQIPLFGRLIALADSFDAMSSNRTYRKALPQQQVLEEVLRCGGAQFDPKLAKVFVTVDFSPFYQMVTEHQNRQSPLASAMRKPQ